jgi:hypothetical protein
MHHVNLFRVHQEVQTVHCNSNKTICIFATSGQKLSQIVSFVSLSPSIGLWLLSWYRLRSSSLFLLHNQNFMKSELYSVNDTVPIIKSTRLKVQLITCENDRYIVTFIALRHMKSYVTIRK